MKPIKLTNSVEWVEVDESDIEQADQVFELDPAAISDRIDLDIQQTTLDMNALGVGTGGPKVYWGGAKVDELRGITTQILDTWRKVGDQGEWGDIVQTERIVRKVPVVGLAAPDIAKATTTARYSFTNKGSGGLKISLGVVSLGLSKTYTLTRELTLECEPGEAKIGAIYVPLDKVTQQYRPPGAQEWFDRDRYAPAPKDPNIPGLGFVADTAAVAELLERATPDPDPYGGGTASFKSSLTREQSVGLEVSLGPKFADDAGSLAISAKVEGSSSMTFDYSLPANASFRLYWLSPLAGACAV